MTLFLLSHNVVVDTMDRYGSNPPFCGCKKVKNGHLMAVTYFLKLPGAYVQFKAGFGQIALVR